MIDIWDIDQMHEYGRMAAGLNRRRDVPLRTDYLYAAVMRTSNSNHNKPSNPHSELGVVPHVLLVEMIGFRRVQGVDWAAYLHN